MITSKKARRHEDRAALWVQVWLRPTELDRRFPGLIDPVLEAVKAG